RVRPAGPARAGGPARRAGPCPPGGGRRPPGGTADTPGGGRVHPPATRAGLGCPGDLVNPVKECAMQPPSTSPPIGEARSPAQGRGYGLVLFASILLLVIGCFNLIYGIAAITKSHVFVPSAHY